MDYSNNHPEVVQQRKNYIVPDEPQAGKAGLQSIAAYTKYANGLYLLDVSSYQAKADKTTNVNWDKIFKEAPWIVGGYCKLGEVSDTVVSKNEDDFLDLSFKTNIEGIRRNHGLAGAYIYLNTGYFGTQLGMGLDDYKNWRRPTEAETLKRILDLDPQIHLIMRQLKVGFGRAPNYAEIKSMPTRDVHFIVLDVEKGKAFYGSWSTKIVSDFEMALNARVTIEELDWLMTFNYLPRMPILLYSGEWFIDSFGGPYLRQVVDENDTICAGYNTFGTTGTIKADWNAIRNTYLPMIPDTWHSPYFGGNEKWGKKVRITQISGDKFINGDVLNDRNLSSAIDINHLEVETLKELTDYYTLWLDSDQLGTITQPPVEIPTTKRYFSTTNSSLNGRSAPNTTVDNVVSHPVANRKMLVTKETDANGYHFICTEVWYAVTSAGKIIEE